MDNVAVYIDGFNLYHGLKSKSSASSCGWTCRPSPSGSSGRASSWSRCATSRRASATIRRRRRVRTRTSERFEPRRTSRSSWGASRRRIGSVSGAAPHGGPTRRRRPTSASRRHAGGRDQRGIRHRASRIGGQRPLPGCPSTRPPPAAQSVLLPSSRRTGGRTPCAERCMRASRSATPSSASHSYRRPLPTRRARSTSGRRAGRSPDRDSARAGSDGSRAPDRQDKVEGRGLSRRPPPHFWWPSQRGAAPAIWS